MYVCFLICLQWCQGSNQINQLIYAYTIPTNCGTCTKICHKKNIYTTFVIVLKDQTLHKTLDIFLLKWQFCKTCFFSMIWRHVDNKWVTTSIIGHIHLSYCLVKKASSCFPYSCQCILLFVGRICLIVWKPY